MTHPFTACRLCPRRCGVNRLAGERGYCGAGRTVEVYRAAPHHGEEPPLSGTRGSGTVFFGRCTLACLYCQNYPWSQEGAAALWGTDALTGKLKALAEAGCHNWNLVSPTPWLPLIHEAVEHAKTDGFSVPVVYNTSGFERREVLSAYRDLVDIYLTDLRYSLAGSARDGSGAEAYVARARNALLWMWEHAGPLRLDADGVAKSGTVCRLLVLPNRAEEAVDNLEWVARNIGTDIALSVMCQYVPAYRAGVAGNESWNRRVTHKEYKTVCDAVEALGFAEGWVQELETTVPGELVGFRMEAD